MILWVDICTYIVFLCNLRNQMFICLYKFFQRVTPLNNSNVLKRATDDKENI